MLSFYTQSPQHIEAASEPPRPQEGLQGLSCTFCALSALCPLTNDLQTQEEAGHSQQEPPEGPPLAVTEATGTQGGKGSTERKQKREIIV